MESSRKSETTGIASATATGSGIRDNYVRGTVGEFLRAKIRAGSDLSVVSAYFTIYAFGALQSRLSEIERMRFLFGEPRFIQSLDPERTDKKAFKVEDEGLQLANRLQQKRLARECADWIAEKAEIRSVRQTSLKRSVFCIAASTSTDGSVMPPSLSVPMHWIFSCAAARSRGIVDTSVSEISSSEY